MKALYAVMAILALMYVMPVITGGSNEISGSSRKAAYKSAIKVKRFLTADERMVFDFAFGVVEEIKTEEGGEKAFLDAVGGLKPEEVIELAKKEVGAKIAARDSKFVQYKSWDDMLYQLTKTNKSLRSLQERPQGG